MLSDRIETAARQLVEAHGAARLSALTPPPATMAQAYRIQARTIALLGAVGGATIELSFDAAGASSEAATAWQASARNTQPSPQLLGSPGRTDGPKARSTAGGTITWQMYGGAGVETLQARHRHGMIRARKEFVKSGSEPVLHVGSHS